MAIFVDDKTRSFFIEGKNVTYSFLINNLECAEHTYFGKKIPHDNLRYMASYGANSCVASVPDTKLNPYSSYISFQPEITFGITGDYRESAVEYENQNGDRGLELLYDSYEIVEGHSLKTMPSMRGGQTLILHLVDKVKKFGADLYYTVFDDCDVIARNIVYKNFSDKEITLNRAYSFSVGLPENNYRFLSLRGAWASERFEDIIPVHYGVVSIDSKRGSSSAVLNPFMALLKGNADEDQGEVVGVNLIYSSSFVLKAEGLTDGDVLLTGGINDYDFCWTLAPNEEFETPQAVLVYSNDGLGGMSRAYHDAYREHLINPRFVKKSRPLLVNNWEATYFDFNPEKLKAIIDGATGTGIDTFVLDDGWFGVRNNDRSSLGDWYTNMNKLPDGLKEISDYAHSKGLKFGLWFEPEMVSPDSDLFRGHPDWAINACKGRSCLGRNQYVLDLTRQEVRDYIVESINSVIRNEGVDYVKWDCNRNITDFYSVGRETKLQREFSHLYALGLYDIFERIVNGNPDILFEGCAGGGARFDCGVLYYFPQIWTSDNTDAEIRTHIQYGTSYVYPLSSMACHVSDCPNHQTKRVTEYQTRADIAHLGATGYELDTSKWSEEDKEMIRRQVNDYKEMEDLILNGDLYRLDNPATSNYFTFNVVSKDKTRAVCTTYRRLSNAYFHMNRLYFKGLDENKNYFIREKNIVLSGAVLVNKGIVAEYGIKNGNGDFKTCVYHLEER